jgi:hypothetical protein
VAQLNHALADARNADHRFRVYFRPRGSPHD